MVSKNSAKIIRFLLRNVEKNRHNINQIAKSTNISLGSSFKILKELEKTGIVMSNKIGNAIYCSLDLANPETVKLCELLLLEEKRGLIGYAKLYSQSIEQFDDAELIVLFGSVLTKKDFNDVDVLFIADNAKKVSAFCLGLSKFRTKPVVPLILRKNDLVKELKDEKDVIVAIIREGVVLKGESLFIEVIKNAKA